MLEKLRSVLAAPFRRALSRVGTKISLIDDLFGGWLGRLDLSKLRDYESYLRAGTRNIWVVWKCCDRVASIVMETPLQLLRINSNGDGQPVKVPELDKLLAVPNPFFNFSEMVYLTVFHIKLTGNAYWFKDQATTMGDRPKQLFVLNPAQVKLVIDNRLGVIGYIYNNGRGVEVPLDVNEVMHFRKPHANNEWYGLGEIEAGEQLFQDWLNRGDYAKLFWSRGASPSGIMSTKEMISDEADLLKSKAMWEEQYAGPRNASKTMFLTGDWTYTKMGLSMEELQNVEASKLSIENICQMMGVPLSVFGIQSAANYATAREDSVCFRNDTIKPLVKLISDTLNSDLVAGYGTNLTLLWTIQGLINTAKVREDLTPMFDRGVLSRNELREALGMARVEDDPLFDQYFLLSTYVPADLAGISAPPQTSAVDQSARSIVDRSVRKLIAPKTNGA